MVFRWLFKEGRIRQNMLARERFYLALGEASRLFADTLGMPVEQTLEQLTELLVRHLRLPVVWIGLLAGDAKKVDILAASGPARTFVDGLQLSPIPEVGGEQGGGSIAEALRTGDVVRRASATDASYVAWRDRLEQFSLRGSVVVPFRSLDGLLGVVVLHYGDAPVLTDLGTDLFIRLAEDLSVFLERRKNMVDLLRLSDYQQAISELLRDFLAAPSMAVAYAQVPRLLVERTQAFAAWVLERNAGGTLQLVTVHGQSTAISAAIADLHEGLDGISIRPEMGLALQALQSEQAIIVNIEHDAQLQACCNGSVLLAPIRVFGAWPIYSDNEPLAVLLVTSKNPHYFSASLQVLLHQLSDALHIADRQFKSLAEIQHRTILYQALLDEGDIVLAAQDEIHLLDNVCQRLVESGLFATVWIGRPDAGHGFTHLASAGLETPSSSLEDEQASLAWHSGFSQYPQPLGVGLGLPARTDQTTSQSAAAIPVRRGSQVWGVLTVVAVHPDIFSRDLMKLLSRVALLLGHGLDELDLKGVLAAEREHQSWLATHDPLTGLANRRGLDDYFAQALLRSARHGRILAVVMLDLDDFKPVNDSYGHEAGDLLLKDIAQRLLAVVRRTDFLVRLGGDEFVLLLEDLEDLTDLQALLYKIQKAVETPFVWSEGPSIQVRASMGLTVFPMDNESPELLLRHADQALYAIKERKHQRSQCWANFIDLRSAPVAL